MRPGWYFLDHPQVPPDNNRAERSLRWAVAKRKVAVIQTYRAQGRSAVEVFERVLSLDVRGRSQELSSIPESD